MNWIKKNNTISVCDGSNQIRGILGIVEPRINVHVHTLIFDPRSKTLEICFWIKYVEMLSFTTYVNNYNSIAIISDKFKILAFGLTTLRVSDETKYENMFYFGDKYCKIKVVYRYEEVHYENI